jgi:hypothetical protein
VSVCEEYGLLVTVSSDGYYLIGRGMTYLGSVEMSFIDSMSSTAEMEDFILPLILYSSF